MKLIARASTRLRPDRRAHLRAPIGLALVAGALALVPVAPAQAATTVYSVPTSNAGLGRIVTAPTGDMWFIEEDVNKVGRITTAGVVTEFDLPTRTTDESSVMDLDIAPDGAVWVVYDSGWNAVRLDPATNKATNYDLGSTVHGDYPYGGRVRVAPDGNAFVTMNYDESFVVRLTPTDIVESPNSPECEDVLGEAADGTMWCQGPGLDQLVRLSADASSGTAFPLPSDATYPQGIAAGPVGSIWFTRSSSGTIFTSPSDGSVGYLDAGNGATTIWKTGSRTAPRDLIQAPDGTMWFTNAGAAPGIGHISATGVGAITAVGNYEPTSLTWGADGAVWFTDAKNNSIVRVTTDELQTTNIDLGSGATMTAPTSPTPTPTPGTALPTGTVVKPSGVVRVKKLKIPIQLTCPASSTQGCAGTLRVSIAKRAISKSVTYRLASGTKKKVVKAKVTAKGKSALKAGKPIKVKVALTAVGGKKAGTTRTLTVLRK